MNNSDFWVSIREIIENDFAPEGLVKLERYAEQFISGQLVYKRFSPFEQYGCSTGGATHVIASLLAGAKSTTNNGTQGTDSFKRECQYGEEQAEKIEKWANRA